MKVVPCVRSVPGGAGNIGTVTVLTEFVSPVAVPPAAVPPPTPGAACLVCRNC